MTDEPYSRNQIWHGSRRVLSSDDLPEGVVVNFHDRSRGNTVHLAEGARYHNVVVDLGSAIDCTITIGKIRVQFGGVRISFVLNSGRCSTRAFVEIGDGCVFNGATHIIGPLTGGIGVRIGRDCLFASGLSFRGASHHGLWDLESGALLNPEVGIEVGDHVWIGDQAVVLNKARIPSGSVVAARSIVNKPFSETHSLLAGAPAAVRKGGVDWTHEFPIDNGATPRTPPAS